MTSCVKLPISHDSLWIHDKDVVQRFPRLSGTQSTDVLVVGAGITGLSAGIELLQRGFDVQEMEVKWSAELYEPVDGLPIIGNVPGSKNLWIATGFSGVGLTWGTAAGRILADLIQGTETSASKLLTPSRFGLSAPWTLSTEQYVPMRNLAERVLPSETIELGELNPGDGKVGMLDGQFVAVCRDLEGKLHTFNPRCVHMGGVVHWNKEEQSWDCPVHGGRYSYCGRRICSPPHRDLEPLQE